MEDATAALGCCAAAHTLYRWACLGCSLRSVSAVTTHLELSREVRGCLRCARLTLPGDVYYACGVCEDTHDICAGCHDQRREVGVAGGRSTRDELSRHSAVHSEHLPLVDRSCHEHSVTGREQLLGVAAGERSSRAEMSLHPMHRERLPLLVDRTPLTSARSTASALAMAFRLYGPRRCLGTRPPSADGKYGEYEWLTYTEAYETALSFGAGLHALIGERRPAPLIGVLGAVCTPWLLSDWGCALKGLGVVLMHRMTTAMQLRHILRGTAMKVLIISTHLRSILAEALPVAVDGCCSALLHVIWLDDPADAHAQTAANTSAASETTLETTASEHVWTDIMRRGAEQPRQYASMPS